MSKELKALKRIEDFMSKNAVHWKQDIAMIETALKNYEEMTLDYEKKLEVFEIAKKNLKFRFITTESELGELYEIQIAGISSMTVLIKTKHEFDLLKETLL